ncbi:MAG: hypothetical protein ACYTG7_13725 [Planctomycetota bacterium]|jgi:hypothetical protein
MALRPKKVYNRLNRARLDSAALSIHWPGLAQLYWEVKSSHEAWIKGGSPSKLAKASQAFTDFLSQIFLVPLKNLSLVDKARPHNRDEQGRVRGELYGSCANEGNIRVYLRTAARGQPTAFKTFFNTLVHEWVHHYDFEALGDTIHCAGFYDRVNVIYKKCIDAKDEPCQKELF